MSDHCRARVIRVKRDKHHAVLASAASIGDTVLLVKDAGDLAVDDEVAGTLLVDDDTGTLLTYTDVEFVEDTDQGDLATPDTVTLAKALTVAIDADTQVWVYEEPDDDPDDDGIVSDWVAICVPEDDEDAAELGGRLHATIPPDKRDDLPVGRQDDPGAPVVLEFDEDTDEWTVLRFRGAARGLRFEADDVYVLTAQDVTAGSAAFVLSHRPLPESIDARWRTVTQEPTEYSVDYPSQTIHWPLDGFEEAGDRLWVHYAYRRGQPKRSTFNNIAYTSGVDNPVSAPSAQPGDVLLLAIALPPDMAGASNLNGYTLVGETATVTHRAFSGDSSTRSYRLAIYQATATEGTVAVPTFPANALDTPWILGSFRGAGATVFDSAFSTVGDADSAASPVVAGSNLHVFITISWHVGIEPTNGSVAASNGGSQIDIVAVSDVSASQATAAIEADGVSPLTTAGWCVAALAIGNP